MLDELGIYGEAIVKLYKECENDMVNFWEKIIGEHWEKIDKKRQKHLWHDPIKEIEKIIKGLIKKISFQNGKYTLGELIKDLKNILEITEKNK